jgi:hypothetical protein
MICLSCHCGNHDHCADALACDCECNDPDGGRGDGTDAAYQSLLADLEADEPAVIETVWGPVPLDGVPS